MSTCHFCNTLTLAPRRFDVPAHLHRIGPPQLDENGHRRLPEYQCSICGSVWRWRDDHGWAEPPFEHPPPQRVFATALARPAPPWLRSPRSAGLRHLSWYQRQGMTLPPRYRALASRRPQRRVPARGWRRKLRGRAAAWGGSGRRISRS